MTDTAVKLPTANVIGKMSLEEALAKRRSVRKFINIQLSKQQLSQILWSAQGITDGIKGRTAPSAGATYPLEIYVIIGNETAEKFQAGIYHYDTCNHSLILHLAGDVRARLAEAALDQDFIAVCPVNIIVCAIFSRTTSRYGKRGERYVYIEAGHVGQNVALEAVSLGLASTMIGAFQDDQIAKVLQLKEKVEPLYIIPIGKSA